MKRVEGRHETLNQRLKQFHCLSRPYLGKGGDCNFLDHSNMFRATCVATNVAMQLGYKELYHSIILLDTVQEQDSSQ